MGKKLSIGVNKVAHKGKKAWIGVNNVAHKAKKAWIGVNDLAVPFFGNLKKAMVAATCCLGSSTTFTHYTRASEDMANWDNTVTFTDSNNWYSGSYMDAVMAFDKLFMSNGSTLQYSEDNGATWKDTGISTSGATQFRLRLLNDKLCFINGNGFNLLDASMTLTTKSITKATSGVGDYWYDIGFSNGYYYALQRKRSNSDRVYIYKVSENGSTMTQVAQTPSYSSIRHASINEVGGTLVIFLEQSNNVRALSRCVYTFDGTTVTNQLATSGFAYYGAGFVYKSDDNTLNTLHVGANKKVLLNTYTVTDGTVTQTVTNEVITTLPFDAVYYASVTYVDGDLVCVYRDVAYAASGSTVGNKPNLWGAVYKNGQWSTQKIIELSVTESVSYPLKYVLCNKGELNGYYYVPSHGEVVLS